MDILIFLTLFILHDRDTAVGICFACQSKRGHLLERLSEKKTAPHGIIRQKLVKL